MSTRRKGKWGPRGTGPNGRKLCYCGCGKELPENANKRSTSIAGHYAEWSKIHNPATVRSLVEQRDKGICAECGVDSEARAREAEQTRLLIYWLARRHAEDLWSAGLLPQPGPAPANYFDCHRLAAKWTREQITERFGEARAHDGHTWEADHIIPVVEGGGECGLENYRTLCLPCHRKATAALAARRAQQRKNIKEIQNETLTLAL